MIPRMKKIWGNHFTMRKEEPQSSSHQNIGFLFLFCLRGKGIPPVCFSFTHSFLEAGSLDACKCALWKHIWLGLIYFWSKTFSKSGPNKKSPSKEMPQEFTKAAASVDKFNRFDRGMRHIPCSFLQCREESPIFLSTRFQFLDGLVIGLNQTSRLRAMTVVANWQFKVGHDHFPWPFKQHLHPFIHGLLKPPCLQNARSIDLQTCEKGCV